MPRIWSRTIEAHRDAVRDATIEATAALVAERGPSGVTMSQIAKDTGIGRATLYKYFPDVESILVAWHDRQVDAQLAELVRVRDRTDGARERLDAVLTAYARAIRTAHPPAEPAAAPLHRGAHVAAAHRRLHEFVRELIADAAAAGDLPGGAHPDELAGFCLHALEAVRGRNPAAVRRLVRATLAGLDAPNPRGARRQRAEPGASVGDGR
ncbi:TetR/AcrR family transcriptional regulator [Actinocatenispora thailandica]|nr:TetR/AcrR family transcriptional regulator [Actinocatenispora thailandica]